MLSDQACTVASMDELKALNLTPKFSAGYNIAGPEVEAALLSHPEVRECAVVGMPDEERGQIVEAHVVLRNEIAGDAEMAKRLQDHVKATIAPFKYPRSVKFTDALPKTQTGKIQRFRLRQGTRPANAEPA